MHQSTPKIHRCRERLRSESGQALVEFALVLPILVLAMMMVLEFGKVFNYWQDEAHLANQAARLAAVDQNPGGGTLQQYVQAQADAPELKNGGTDSVASPAKVCITPGAAVGDPVKATVTINYKWLPILGGVSSTNISGSATMRMERPATNYSAGCSS
jgi:Flp pilus assembly protein TadG